MPVSVFIEDFAIRFSHLSGFASTLTRFSAQKLLPFAQHEAESSRISSRLQRFSCRRSPTSGERQQQSCVQDLLHLMLRWISKDTERAYGGVTSTEKLMQGSPGYSNHFSYQFSSIQIVQRLHLK